MSEENNTSQISPSAENKLPNNSHIAVAQVRRRLMLGISLVLVLILLSSAAVAVAFLAGRLSKNNLETQRQTVVQEGDVIADIAETVGQSVVSVLTSQQQLSLFSRSQTAQAAGTGLIIDESGLILTNKHVVPEGLTTVAIVTADGARYEQVEIIGRDPLNDLAILKVGNPKNFKIAQLANSDEVRTGQKVIAIGNALGQFQNTVTSGIVSGLGRPIEAGDESGQTTEQLTNLFQTDAAINSGNSGGPLLNFNGEVIGINTAVAADAENIGFAIPINEAKGIIASVQQTGRLSRPYIGVRYTTLTKKIADQLGLSVSEGAYVADDDNSVINDSPAERAGIKGGDVIAKVNEIDLSQRTPLASAVSRFKVGDTVSLDVVRDGRRLSLKVTLAEAPAQ